MYKNDTNYEGKRLRATTFAIAEMSTQSNREKSNIAIAILKMMYQSNTPLQQSAK